MSQPDRPPPPLALRLFGPFEACLHGHPLPRLRSREGHWLLALLALRAGREVERGWITATFWPDSQEEAAAANLRSTLKDQRRALGPEAGRLHSPTRHTLRLELAGLEVDVLDFDRAMGGEDGPALDRAVALYRGRLLEGCPEEWAFEKRQVREHAYLGALETLAEQALAENDAAAAVGYMRRATAVDPLRESAQRGLMRALAAGGNYAAALVVFRELRLRLHRELNCVPDPETKALFESLRERAKHPAQRAKQAETAGVTPDDRPALLPPLRPLETRPHIFPTPPTPLIGRDQELATVRALLLEDGLRLVTLTGAGGSGKTRLALAVAAELPDQFQDGVWFVDLAPIRDPALVVATVAQTLGVRETSGPPLLEGVKRFLWEKALLLVLDNFEHVLAAAPTVAELLRAAPSLKVLVTSRAVLRLRGEQEFPVPPLALPPVVDGRGLMVDGPTGSKTRSSSSRPLTLNPQPSTINQYAAVELFVQRAVNAKPDFALTSENAPAVAEICHCLDGLPLALELAAARIRFLTPEALVARLGGGLDLLTGGARDAPARQQTLRNTVTWSYELLGEGEKRLFRRLSVFVGGYTLEAAEAVCNGAVGCQPSALSERDAGYRPPAVVTDEPDLTDRLPPTADSRKTDGRESMAGGPIDVLDGIASLVEQSLLRQTEGPPGELRFSMLETILEFGRERLAESGEEEAVRRRHARFFLTQVEATEPQLRGPGSMAWHERWDAELNNLRAALTWAAEKREPAMGLRLLVGLRWFWFNRAHEGLAHEALTKLLALSEAAERNSLRGWALMLGGHLRLGLMADYEGTRQLLEESRAIAEEVGDRTLVAHALGFHGFAASSRGDPCAAASLFAQSLAIAREVNDRPLIAAMLSPLSAGAARRGDFGTARAYLEERLAVVQAIGQPELIANTLVALGHLAYEQGNTANARALYEQSLALHREMGHPFNIVRPLHGLGDLALEAGVRSRPSLCTRNAWRCGGR